ncbi:MAG: hypothetical protein OSB21_09605 [Myxococcota bacterium]|nr:hypothetical protein [Myxococcota bacterium]
MRTSLFAFSLILVLAACPQDDPALDAGIEQQDAATADLGPAPGLPDAGFGGGIVARCQRDIDCDDPSHKCLVGNYPNTRLRCSATCVRLEQCFDFAEGAGISNEEVVCELPSNRVTTRLWCIQTPPPPPDAGPDGGSAGDGGLGDGGDTGPAFDAGAGQLPGSRCTANEQCRNMRCVPGFSGDKYCTVPCTGAEDCFEFRTNSQLDEAHSACAEHNGENVCIEVAAVPRVGWSAVLARGLNEVRARILLTENRGLRVRDFYYDGGRHGQEVYIGVSLGPVSAQSFVPVSIDLRCRGGVCGDGHPCAQTLGTCNDADFELLLPEGLAYEAFDRVAIVGMPQGLGWSEAVFVP